MAALFANGCFNQRQSKKQDNPLKIYVLYLWHVGFITAPTL